ncbi:MAG: response regulator [Candidatus Thiodiazotropha sp. (ex Gloverina cf. vestifex)]|nr:response regulator [Candidatus Thiodiazotropha sp. (ex Gloverina cf. vestifex)]
MGDLFGRLRYLIIDDFEQMRVSFKGMLTSFGAVDIETCACGEQGLKSLSVRNYDVVICDYNLGDGKDGQQVLEEARHLGYLGHACSFFLITAESNMPMVLGAL